MDKASEFYRIAEENGVEVLGFPLPETGSLCIEQDGR